MFRRRCVWWNTPWSTESITTIPHGAITDRCPAGLDIPRLIELYNEHILTTKAGLFGFIAPMALAAVPQDKQPAACLHCRSCEQVCPQQIKISDVMEDFVKVLGE